MNARDGRKESGPESESGEGRRGGPTRWKQGRLGVKTKESS